MISKITIKNTPPFDKDEQYIDNLKKINFFFGSNGSGKTTISRIIANPSVYSESAIKWDSDIPLECAVYNSDFIRENFSEELPGIFTLGVKEKGIDEQIKVIKKTQESLTKAKKALSNDLHGDDKNGGAEKELKDIEERYTKTFWESKQRLSQSDSPMENGLEGVLNNKENFKKRLLTEANNNKSILYEKALLEEQAKQIYDKNFSPLEEIADIDFERVIPLEESDILQKKVIGKTDVDIASLIKTLGNSDWVQKGLPYLEKSNGKCPFCQRDLPENFDEKIADYFDDTYTNDMNSIQELSFQYSSESKTLINSLQKLADEAYSFIDNEKLNAEIERLKSTITANEQIIKDKQNNPSTPASFRSISGHKERILALIKAANTYVLDNNAKVINIDEERNALSSKIWKYIIDEQRIAIEEYQRNKEIIENKITKIKDDLRSNEKALNEAENKRKELEKDLTSIEPTKDAINGLLKSFGFNGFSLTTSDDKRAYQLRRKNGSLATDTLSEGEKNFVSFLYFFYSLRGSQENTGRNNDKIVVVDDPVSSLDNDVLFIVSSLLRDMFADIANDKSTIKQIIILSHNVFFFKEVSYFDSAWKGFKQKIGYWTVTKIDDHSSLQEHIKNPVSSTYDMLWAELRNANDAPQDANISILPNIMRRILEYYYGFLGDTNLRKLPMKFPDGERQICKSLISWAHAGSHAMFDDYSCTVTNTEGLMKYLQVFQKVFKETNHIAHYNLMMKIENTEENDNGQA